MCFSVDLSNFLHPLSLKILLSKNEKYGFRGKTLNVTSSFVGEKLFHQCEWYSNKTAFLTYGFPQGPVPIPFFVLFI